MPDHVVATILVADLVGSSNFADSEKNTLFDVYHKEIDHLFSLNNYKEARIKSETAGDGLHIVFSDAVAAGNYALDLLEFMENHDWLSCGLHTLPGIRIALHTGIVYRHFNPVTNTFDYSGHAHDLVSRIEPITARDEVFASRDYAAYCSLRRSNLYFMPIGRRALKKSAGSMTELLLYRLCRQGRHLQDIDWQQLSVGQAALFRTQADWSWLISLCRSRKVVPVIGPELLRVSIWHDGGMRDVNLYDYAVKMLAGELGISYSENLPFMEIFDLCCKKSRSQTEIRFKEIIEKITRVCDPPEALLKLVAMNCFPGYIVTTPDSLLKKALQKVHGQGNDESWLDDWELFAGEKEFRGRDFSDISANTDAFSADYPFIFHIFGQMNSHSEFYALSENDMLMFARAWNHNEPKNLKRFLQGREENERKTILLLGCNYDNWYARLFLFNLSAASTCATLHRDCGIVADNVSRYDTAFGMFLARDNYGKVFYDGDAVDFVDRLAESFSKKHGEEPERKPVSGVVVIAAGSDGAEIANSLRDQLKTARYTTKLIRESEMQNPLRLGMILESAAVFIPIVAPGGALPKDVLGLACKEAIRRKNDFSADYYLMPFFMGDADGSVFDVEVPEGNCLRMAAADTPLDENSLEKIYQNLCAHEKHVHEKRS